MLDISSPSESEREDRRYSSKNKGHRAGEGNISLSPYNRRSNYRLHYLGTIAQVTLWTNPGILGMCILGVGIEIGTGVVCVTSRGGTTGILIVCARTFLPLANLGK